MGLCLQLIDNEMIGVIFHGEKQLLYEPCTAQTGTGTGTTRLHL